MASPRLPETEGSIPKSQLALRCHSPERVYDSEEFRDQDGPAYVRNGRLQRWARANIPTH
jgi:hypothetical protein